MGSSQRILVADDERHIVRLLQVNLERAGHSVQVAHSGAQAIQLLNSETFDRAILDYTMPSPNGYEVLELVRANKATKDMWVGLMVPSSEIESVRALPVKADWYSNKPFDPTNIGW